MSFWGRFSRQGEGLAGLRGKSRALAARQPIAAAAGRRWVASAARHRGITATASAAAVLVAAGGTLAALSRGPSQETLSGVSSSKPLAKNHSPAAKERPLRLVSVTPAGGTHGVNGASPISVTFSAPISPASPLPRLSPSIAGSWHVSGDTATFTPRTGYLPGTTVTVTVPSGMRGVATSAVKKASKVRFTTGSYSVLRLQELLAQLGYLPFTWTPADPTAGQVADGDANGQLAAAYDAPAGSFSWKGSYPRQLTRQWKAGTDNTLVTGAVRAFEYDQGLTMDGEAGPDVWSHLLTAIAKGQDNKHGYTYALATQGASDESLQVWHDGKKILDTPANTGIPASPTEDGTFPVYERLQFQIMSGTNPDGSQYHDPVYWVAYFNGGDAVHYFARYSYGYYQSLGCVELEWSPAKYIWPYMTYGTLVTVQGPVA